MIAENLHIRLMKICCLTTLILGFSGCQHRKKDDDYVQREYREQRDMRSDRLSTPAQDEQDSSEFVLQIEPPLEKREWQRRPYETIDDWLDRLRHILLANQDIINELRTDSAELDEDQAKHAAKLGALIKRNEQLRAEINKPKDKEPHVMQTVATPAPIAPFTVHVVKRKETLFSIAMEHYGTGAMVKEIMLWNQGWIRDPDALVAGMGLVLFPVQAGDTHQKVVDQYLHQVATTPIRTSME